jgi:hypothetical protein
MAFSQVTASSSLDALTDAADAAVRAALHTLNVPGRERHSQRAQKARPKFPHTSGIKQTATGKPQVTVFAPSRALTMDWHENRKEGGTAPPSGAAGRGTRAAPAATGGQLPCPHITTRARKQTQRQVKHARTETTRYAANT